MCRPAFPRLLGVALVAKGYLTDGQLVALIDEQRRRMNEPAAYAPLRKEDLLFGKLAVKHGQQHLRHADPRTTMRYNHDRDVRTNPTTESLPSISLE